MTKDEHYTRAEDIVLDVANRRITGGISPEEAGVSLQQAQVHATLALVTKTPLTARFKRPRTAPE